METVDRQQGNEFDIIVEMIMQGQDEEREDVGGKAVMDRPNKNLTEKASHDHGLWNPED